MYGCSRGTIFAKPASTVRREAETAKRIVRSVKSASSSPRRPKTKSETTWISLSRFMAGS
jgi:hypothetical protein